MTTMKKMRAQPTPLRPALPSSPQNARPLATHQEAAKLLSPSPALAPKGPAHGMPPAPPVPLASAFHLVRQVAAPQGGRGGISVTPTAVGTPPEQRIAHMMKALSALLDLQEEVRLHQGRGTQV